MTEENKSFTDRPLDLSHKRNEPLRALENPHYKRASQPDENMSFTDPILDLIHKGSEPLQKALENPHYERARQSVEDYLKLVKTVWQPNLEKEFPNGFEYKVEYGAMTNIMTGALPYMNAVVGVGEGKCVVVIGATWPKPEKV
jgi:hypothetical protein